jgi:dihydrofolate reductase
MRIAIVVAATDDGVMGKDNALPWRLPDDLKRFKQLTMGKPIVMGRKTFESIGKALPGRRNIVISRQRDFVAPGCDVVGSVEAALATASEAAEVSVIGGAEIFRQVLPNADLVHLTLIHAKIDGDVFFPSLKAPEWRAISQEEHPVDERHAHPFTFLTLERKK